jgi:proteasome assembly chaperone (PAC2) family protein
MAEALRYQVRPTLRRPALVLALEGWNDAGEAATTAARYIAQHVQAVPLAEIDPEEFYDFTVRRPEIHVEDGVLRSFAWPRNEFLYGAADPDWDLVIGIGAEPHLHWRSFSEQIATLVRDLGIRQVALLGAYLADVLYSRPVAVTCVASSGELRDRLRVEGARYQGATGMIGLLCHRLRDEGCQVVSLWAGLPHYIRVSPNPRGSLALIEALRDFLGLRLDLAPLQRSAAECEERVSAMVAADPELSEYVRQLKRREFAQ